IAGIPVAIENAAGSIRRDIHHDPPRWETRMQAHYGRIKRTTGGDGEPVDVFGRPGTPRDWSGPVFVVDQVKQESGKWDEHKAVLGVNSADEARGLYRAHYPAGFKVGPITQMSLPQF